jgi:hypothetical protein
MEPPVRICVLLQTGNDKTITQTSNSLWSSASLFMPAVPEVPGLDLRQLVPEGMLNCNKISGLPSTAALVLPEQLSPNDGPCCIPQHTQYTSVSDKVSLQLPGHAAAPCIYQILLRIVLG